MSAAVGGAGCVFLVDEGAGSDVSSLPVSRPTQSRMASEMATEWIEFGEVRARVVARVPPMRQPNREILRLPSPLKARRRWLKAVTVSWMGRGKVWVGGQRR